MEDSQLISSVQDGDLDVLVSLLDQGRDPNACDVDGGSALYWTALLAREAMARVLLARGADPNAPNSTGMVPLTVAAFGGHTELGRILLAAGAQADVGDVDGMTPLMVAAKENRRK